MLAFEVRRKTYGRGISNMAVVYHVLRLVGQFNGNIGPTIEQMREIVYSNERNRVHSRSMSLGTLLINETWASIDSDIYLVAVGAANL